ncbi:unnamed protein product [Microthlaspi erraticum]|uniref:Uncharacterized protein n=1 Tax=Microthlaspi erraticum TaxID=1685480 RepID=A0A6D2LLD4_9BRAS|nr:unnamed protein product [Microthlaspi erraticum]
MAGPFSENKTDGGSLLRFEISVQIQTLAGYLEMGLYYTQGRWEELVHGLLIGAKRCSHWKKTKPGEPPS